ncbi:hypothetical protein [Heyndrickxia camelliae]|uniref:Uncharacterized protein n=1 Tax=Heyndrickxia camelliae TaxID=1707093 RepID=A0A2N3LFW7_9BACI|nr:hypothetical protein [Heyndrickxia camelliae]PKR83516.1 hypothetical protein CWO92_18290 [Heyndrickxia camelliae]
MLIELKDGGITEIYTDRESYGGCDTCDWGSQYINEFRVEMTTGNIKVEIDQMYDYAVSEDYLMKLFFTNIDLIKSFTETEFFNWIESQLTKDFNEQVEKLKIEFVSK